jgi:hypothetical protein
MMEITPRRHRFGEWVVAIGIFYPALASILAGIFTIGWQCLHWLKTATWQPLSLRDGLVIADGDWWRSFNPQTGLLGLDQILRWALDGFPLAAWLIIGVPLFLIAPGSALMKAFKVNP